MKYFVIDPVILDLGIVQIYWYGVMYLTHQKAFLSKKHNINTKDVDDLIFYGIIGLILGARFGYVLFYNLNYYINDPTKVFYVWEGGLSFHGGLLGIIVTVYLFSKSKHFSFLTLTDLICASAPVGIFLGRISNFINGELWGKVTSSAFGIYAPDQSGIWAQRYPTQLYEALLEGVVLFFILWFFSNTHFFNGNFSFILKILWNL